MSDYFHESMVAKMVTSNGYQQGYSVGFASGYNQGRAAAIDEFIIWLTEQNISFHKWHKDKKCSEWQSYERVLNEFKEEQK